MSCPVSGLEDRWEVCQDHWDVRRVQDENIILIGLIQTSGWNWQPILARHSYAVFCDTDILEVWRKWVDLCDVDLNLDF
jgi:hypothetical protein